VARDGGALHHPHSRGLRAVRVRKGGLMGSVIDALLVLISILATVQSGHTLYLTLWTWDRPPDESRAPEQFEPPRLSFTIMLPARHEEAVIAGTIERVVKANYPTKLLQVFVICSADDEGTISEAEAKIVRLSRDERCDASVVVFDDGPINKPHGLNAALPHATHDVVTIFDAEDDIHPDIFNVVNTVMMQERVKVVQAGVQLMNFNSTWYSALNVLEYFFWFKSRLHYHARAGCVPLGGNTVFFDRELIADIGGWDEQNLTEDADIGLRLSATGERIRVVYDDRYVTKEETPPTLQHFIKQRTRWSQGFMQTLMKGTWRKLPTRKQRWLTAYTLVFPIVQAFLGAYIVLSLLTIVAFKTPVWIAIITYLPVLMLLGHLLTAIVGLQEFARAHDLETSGDDALHLALAWIPYQLVLAYASFRALGRQLRGITNWEKTQHVGAHRERAYVSNTIGTLDEAGDHAA
jgi:cellulose synthase/poly-beta-1,6-N-acetylglucosamine synthase-like glycosyltransferase